MLSSVTNIHHSSPWEAFDFLYVFWILASSGVAGFLIFNQNISREFKLVKLSIGLHLLAQLSLGLGLRQPNRILNIFLSGQYESWTFIGAWLLLGYTLLILFIYVLLIMKRTVPKTAYIAALLFSIFLFAYVTMEMRELIGLSIFQTSTHFITMGLVTLSLTSILISLFTHQEICFKKDKTIISCLAILTMIITTYSTGVFELNNAKEFFYSYFSLSLILIIVAEAVQLLGMKRLSNILLLLTIMTAFYTYFLGGIGIPKSSLEFISPEPYLTILMHFIAFNLLLLTLISAIDFIRNLINNHTAEVINRG